MEVTITYLPEEEREAKVARAFISALCGGMRIEVRNTNPPFKSICLATEKPKPKKP